MSSWESFLIVFLAVVDLCALGVGLTILRRVTRQVRQSGEAIHTAVKESIEQAKKDAVGQFMIAVAPALQKVSETVPQIIRGAVEAVDWERLVPASLSGLSNLHVTGGGHVEVVSNEQQQGLQLHEVKEVAE